jgi:hypothetical protein
MPDDELRDERDDEWGVGWEAHRRHQLTLALKATPAQRLAWLEEVIALAHRTGALPKSRA